MHLQTTLIIPDNNLQLKINNRSHFLNFLHPLHILKKTNTQKQQQKINTAQQNIEQSNTNILNLKKNFVTLQKKIDNFISTERKQQKKQINFLNGFRQNNRNTQNICDNNRKIKNIQQKLSVANQNNHSQRLFNEDDGILQHLINKFYCQKKSSLPTKYDMKIKKQENIINETKEPNCFILFGFSVSLLQIQQFLSLHPEINLTVKIYRYQDSDFFKQIEICQEDDLQIEEKLIKLRRTINQKNLLDCEEITFVLNLWTRNQNVLNIQNQDKVSVQFQERIEIGEFYFFPNINTQKRVEDKDWIKSRIIERQSSGSEKVELNSFAESSTMSYDGNMSSLRKSHQIFRILQVLEYYMSPECHSEHIMISSSESLVIREFLNSVYEKQLKKFYIFIDHQSKQSEARNNQTQRSIIPMQKQQNGQSFTPFHTSNYLSSCAEPQFVSVNGQMIINDQFLSKLSSIKPPQPCTDSPQFRNQKKYMYYMKLQQYHEQKQLRKAKKQFTQMINYLNSLIGLERLNYDQISLQSLKTIKNAKIKQSTLELKQLVNLSHEKEIRYQDLKSKIALYEQIKAQHDQNHDSKLSALRKEIIDLQKQLNLHKNQISNIYQMKSQEQILQQSNVTKIQNTINQRTSIQQEKSILNSMQKSLYQSKVEKLVTNNNSSLKQKLQQLPQNNVNDKQTKLLNKSKITALSKNQFKPNGSIAPRQSFIKPQVSSPKSASILGKRNSSQQFLNKYAPILEQLRKQKYEQQLKKQKTRCQFEAQKQFQKLKEQYKKATKDLLLVLGDCD